MYYTYIIWNKETKMKYIGMHKHRDDLDTYYGSPKSKRCAQNIEFQRLLKEDRDVLKKRVLKWFDSYEDVEAHEIYLHAKYNVDNNPNFYNDSRQRLGGFYCDQTGMKRSADSKAKMSKKQKEIGNAPPNAKTWWTEEHSKNTSERMKGNTNRTGIKDSEETRKKKSEAFKNSEAFQAARRKPITEEARKIHAENGRKTFLINNPMNSEESRKKVSEAKKGLKGLYKNNERKMAKPNSDKWVMLIADGWLLTNAN